MSIFGRTSTRDYLSIIILSASVLLILLIFGCSGVDADSSFCNTDADCPADKPFCLESFCSDGSVQPPAQEDCQNHTDCPAGKFCDLLTGECLDGRRPCAIDSDCPFAYECSITGYCEPAKEPDQDPACESAYDCEPEFICSNGQCEPFDPSTICQNDADCPADHTCSFGSCEGCVRDACCLNSEAGPNCAIDNSAPVPPGYCYDENNLPDDWEVPGEDDVPGDDDIPGDDDVPVYNGQWSNATTNEMIWSSAINYCQRLTEGGSSNWRLPTINELRSLIATCTTTKLGGSCSITDNCADRGDCWSDDCHGCTFEDDHSYSILGHMGSFWSSSKQTDRDDYAWIVSFSYGNVTNAFVQVPYRVICISEGN